MATGYELSHCFLNRPIICFLPLSDVREKLTKIDIPIIATPITAIQTNSAINKRIPKNKTANAITQIRIPTTAGRMQIKSRISFKTATNA